MSEPCVVPFDPEEESCQLSRWLKRQYNSLRGMQARTRWNGQRSLDINGELRFVLYCCSSKNTSVLSGDGTWRLSHQTRYTSDEREDDSNIWRKPSVGPYGQNLSRRTIGSIRFYIRLETTRSPANCRRKKEGLHVVAGTNHL